MTDDAADADVVDAEVIDAEVIEDGDLGAEDLFGIGSDGPISGRDVIGGQLSDEDALVETVELAQRLEAEKNEYLDLARRVQADFENYRKRTESQRVEIVGQATARLVTELLPVLDACEAALAHGLDDVGPIHGQLIQVLAKHGLVPVSDVEVSFDPNIHEAVLTEPVADEDEGPTVAEVLRTGYLWNGRVIRAAMVKVRG